MSTDGGIHATRDHNVRSVLLNTTKKPCVGQFRTKGEECWHTVYCSSMTMRVRIQLLALEHCWSILIGSCLTILNTVLILILATTTCLPNWRTRGNHSTSAIMRRWLKVSKHGWANRRQTSLTHAYKTYSPLRDVPQFRRWLRRVADLVCTYFLLYTTSFFSLLVLLAVRRRLLSE
jgi:hypothetical protein